MIPSSAAFSDSKKHFVILDALRGVAAIVVVLFHIFEIYSGGDHAKQLINHGYLAVDFFFMLSGYVMAHAYDDRWSRMAIKHFFKRRLIRLHPLIVLGMTLGALCFYFGASDLFQKIEETHLWQLLLVTLMGYVLLPLPSAMDIRGWREMYPLNSPAWSLFFEYLANILYAIVLRRLSKRMLSILVFFSAVALIHLAVMAPQGDIIGGWSLEWEQLKIGFTRLLFPYMAGMLLQRTIKVRSRWNTFLGCSLLLIGVLSFPRVGGDIPLWTNGLYDALAVIVLFPLLIYLAVLGEVKSQMVHTSCTFLGDVSYPLYILHFPFIYLFYAWVTENNIQIVKGTLVGIGVLLFMLLVSYGALKWYDEPIRKRLARRYMRKKAA